MIIREYEPGMDNGVGYDTLSGKLRGDGVVRTQPEAPMDGEGQEIWFRLQQVASSQELMKYLDVSTSASISVGLFGSGSVKAKFASEQRINKYSLYFLVRVVVKNPARRMRDVRLNQDSEALLRNGSEAFRQRYGDEFVVGLITGGEYFALLEVEAKDEQQKQDISSSIRAKGATWNLGIEFQSSMSEISSRYSVKVYSYQIGGIPSIARTVEEMINKAVNFPEEVRGRNAVPYLAILLDYKALTLPDRVNLIDVTHQKQIIAKLWEYRLKCFDALSDIEYVLNYPTQFQSFNREKLEQQADQLRNEINRLTEMASGCANDYKACKLPTNIRLPEVLLPRQTGALTAKAQYYDLVAYPPGLNSLSARQWLHHQCQGELQIGDNGRIRCQRCKRQRRALDWSITDGYHLSDLLLEGEQLDNTSVASLAGQLTITAGKGWLTKFLKSLQ